MEVEVGVVHRVFSGTPEKVIKKRVLETLATEGKPVYKAVAAQRQLVESPDFVLKEGEILITHKQVSSEHEKNLELAKAGCSELVVVVESLLLLQEDYDAEFLSLRNMREYIVYVQQIMANGNREEKPTFSRFCYGFWKALAKQLEEGSKDKSTGKGTPPHLGGRGKKVCTTQDAILEAATIGAKLFTTVGKQVAANHPYNQGLHVVAEFNEKNLRAWVALYKKMEGRHQQSHPFKFIGHDVNTAQSALAVLEFVANTDRYKVMYPLLNVAIPHIKKVIQDHHKALLIDNLQEESEEEMMAETLALLKVKVEDALRMDEEQEQYFEFDYGSTVDGAGGN